MREVRGCSWPCVYECTCENSAAYGGHVHTAESFASRILLTIVITITITIIVITIAITIIVIQYDIVMNIVIRKPFWLKSTPCLLAEGRCASAGSAFARGRTAR